MDKITKLFGFQFFPVHSRPLGTSSPQSPLPTKMRGRDRPSSQAKRWAHLVQP